MIGRVRPLRGHPQVSSIAPTAFEEMVSLMVVSSLRMVVRRLSSFTEEVVHWLGHGLRRDAVDHAPNLDGGSHTQLIREQTGECEVESAPVLEAQLIAHDADDARCGVVVVRRETNVGEPRCLSLGRRCNNLPGDWLGS